MHLNRWQKVLVFVLSILIVPFLTFYLVFFAVFATSGPGSGDGAAILAAVYGLPIGIILGLIFPFILFPLLEKIKPPDKEKIEFTLKFISRFWLILVLADISWALFAAFFAPWILGSGWGLAKGWIYKLLRADTFEQHIAIYEAIGAASRVGTWLIVAINLIFLFLITWLRKLELYKHKERQG